MATTAWVVKAQKRKEMKERYFELRQQLKKEGNYAALSRLPRDASPVRSRNRCQLTGSPPVQRTIASMTLRPGRVPTRVIKARVTTSWANKAIAGERSRECQRPNVDRAL